MPVYHPRALVQLSVVFRDDLQVRELKVVPRRVEVERNDHRTADTCTVELDYRDYPLDPRAVQTVLVRVWMGDVGATGSLVLTDQQRQFIGYVDDPETTLEDSGEVVRLTCRDYTSLFLDHRWTGAVDLDRDVFGVARAIVGAVPGADGIQLTVEGRSSSRMSDLVGRSLYTPSDDATAWSVLADVLAFAGLVPVIELDRLVVRAPKRLAQRSVQLDYGRDLERLRFFRRGGEGRPKPVRVHVFNPETRTNIVVTYPSTVQSGSVLPWYLTAPLSRPQVERIAKTFYESTSAQYVEGRLTTREMRASDEDLTLLANGDEVKVRLYPLDRGELEGLSRGELYAELTLGDTRARMRPDVARAFVEAWGRTSSQEQRRFYVKAARHSWDREEGYRLDVDFINRVVAEVT